MKYDGIIDQEIKDSAKEVLALPDEGRETRIVCLETIDRIQTALMKIRANCNLNAVLDYLLLGILEVKFKCQK